MSSLLPNGKQHFDDNNGRPLVGGRVYYYIPNTSTPKDTWQDESMAVLNTNPIVLDARGECTAWGEGSYRQVVRDQYGSLIWDRLVTDTTQGFRDLAGPNGSSLIGFMQDGSGAKPRTLQAKNREIVSVKDYGAMGDGVADDQGAIVDAVAYCYGSGANLFWPPGNYVSSNSIPHFHAIGHRGPGALFRASNAFYPGEQSGATVNQLFISASGTAGNDGLGESQPTTLDQVTLYLKNYGPHLYGQWEVIMDASLFSGLTANSRISGMSSDRFVTFRGPDVGGHPNVPTAIIDGSGGISTLFVSRGWGLRLQFKDVFFKNTLGSSISATEGMTLQCVNVHQENCAQGITWGTHAEVYISGGVHKFLPGFAGFALMRGLFLSKHNIGYRIDEDTFVGIGDPEYNGPRLYGAGAGRGISLQENATGHVRSILADNFAVGMEVISSSRGHIEYSEFTRNSVAVDLLTPGANIFDNGVIWNGRGSNRNSITVNYRGGVKIPTMIGPIVQLVGFVDAQGTTVSGATPTIVATPYTWDGNDNRPGMLFKVIAQGAIAGLNDLKTLRLVCSGTLICSITFPAAAAGAFYVEMGFIKKAGDFVLPFGVGNCAGLSGAAAGVGEAVVQYQEVNKILDDGLPKTIDLQVFTNNASDSITFGTVHCYRAG